MAQKRAMSGGEASQPKRPALGDRWIYVTESEMGDPDNDSQFETLEAYESIEDANNGILAINPDDMGYPEGFSRTYDGTGCLVLEAESLEGESITISIRKVRLRALGTVPRPQRSDDDSANDEDGDNDDDGDDGDESETENDSGESEQDDEDDDDDDDDEDDDGHDDEEEAQRRAQALLLAMNNR
jgi:hypothetical protein